uniref:Nucleolar protein 56 n=1 Tax=Alexandrium monilatum TaxID=311494 RepID=A0A7S4W2P5_9DINO|mmetsp:Transcript_6170/g.18484  ORF Transcript_6170/g.18484 Transcript_6170/m.18484 type:complete len:514 (+) Transcript_6170:83-1624(+)|eukprot:CAMPEP_0175365890 /NCGR_PEP_ID=MMETSP0095-20121207/18856_1 /TAXON_ID=311494 /ORGANISM="Alexandrium monilatum, Strain CCMP3105" /LENGTH=513 /DNA_ID=CAMNT_0016663883 /DNA_START=25 /DNA_END=1566 /DNA_ORIENTATION=+
MSTNLYLLYESAAGYALFLRKEFEETAENESEVQESIQDLKKFGKIVTIHAWVPFSNAEEALEQVNSIAAGMVTDVLKNFLEMNLPKKKYRLGVYDPELGKQLADDFKVTHGSSVRELLRGCRLHFARLVKNLNELDLDKARLGLGHSFSRSRMQLDPNRQDKPIINTIALLDNLDKNINTFAMRVREWYAWHFPELTKIVTDNIAYAKVARVVRVRSAFAPNEGKEKLVEACGAEEVADDILKALRMSMGQDIVEMDMKNIDHFANEVIKLASMRKSLHEYLKAKMDLVAPNLCALIGEIIGARLISHAGSLTNLAKYPASTVQILGAEKALFRALKTKGNTPKYGLIFHSTFIGRAQQKNKGRISRYLANKCSLASRIDNFSEEATTVFGEKLRDQVEERLAFLTEGTTPRKNIEVMQEAIKEMNKRRRKKKKKDEAKKAGAAEGEAVEEGVVEVPKKKKKKAAEEEEEPVQEEPPKKKKKRQAVEEEAEAEPVEEEEPKKKKKKRKDSEA